MRRPTCVFTALLIAACGGTPEATPDAVLSGEAFYLERMATPPGSTLEVELIDLGPDDRGPTVLAGATATVEQPPFAFSLGYDPTRLRRGRSYVVVARLRDAEGRQLFATTDSTSAPFQADSLHRLRLVRTVGDPAAEALTGAEGRAYRCGSLAVTARFDGRLLILTLPDRELRLAPAGGPSDARFGDDQNAFVSRGDGSALLTLDGNPPVECGAVTGASP